MLVHNTVLYFQLGHFHMKISLNGWRRLWIVSAAAYAVALVLVAFVKFPSLSDIPAPAELTQKLPREYRELLHGLIPDDGLKAQFPNGHILNFRAGVTDSQVDSVAKVYSSIMNDELEANRKHFIVLLFAAWLIPVTLAYAIGEGVAWIRRGFSSSRTNNAA